MPPSAVRHSVREPHSPDSVVSVFTAGQAVGYDASFTIFGHGCSPDDQEVGWRLFLLVRLYLCSHGRLIVIFFFLSCVGFLYLFIFSCNADSTILISLATESFNRIWLSLSIICTMILNMSSFFTSAF